jgi:hypothetical protein
MNTYKENAEMILDALNETPAKWEAVWDSLEAIYNKMKLTADQLGREGNHIHSFYEDRARRVSERVDDGEIMDSSTARYKTLQRKEESEIASVWEAYTFTLKEEAFLLSFLSHRGQDMNEDQITRSGREISISLEEAKALIAKA